MNYYNENCAKTAAWLRELIKAGEIPEGVVDERSIVDVRPADLAGFIQCHFFAGIGGWSLALKLAGWPETRPVWTGSCPCQPFSVAGKGMGESDERHLWPYFRNLIGHCRPPEVFGEQVASPAGREWLAGVRADLERAAYAVGSSNLCAAGVTAPHKRQRLYWVAYTNECSNVKSVPQFDQPSGENGLQKYVFGMENPVIKRCAARSDAEPGQEGGGALPEQPGESGGMVQPDRPGRDARLPAGQTAGHGSPFKPASGPLWVGEPIQQGLEGQSGYGQNRSEPRRLDSQPDGPVAAAGAVVGMGNSQGDDQRRERKSETGVGRNGETGGPGAWSDFDILHMLDGKTRRVESGSFPLAHGVSGRVGLLRGYGNGIVPPLTTKFIAAYLETR